MSAKINIKPYTKEFYRGNHWCFVLGILRILLGLAGNLMIARLLQQVMEKKGYYTPAAETYGLQFTEDVTLNGEQANEVTVKFKSGKTTTLKYDAVTKEYKLFMHGTEHIDGNTGDAVTFKNVIAIYTDQRVYDGAGHKVYETIGSGEGYAAINGQIVPIKWNRGDLRSNYTYTLADGTPLTLDVGTTYIALVGIKNPIAYQ